MRDTTSTALNCKSIIRYLVYDCDMLTLVESKSKSKYDWWTDGRT